LCLTIDSGTPACRTGVTPSFPDELAATAHSTWTVTLISADENTPTVDLALSWPADNPSVTLTDGRFQGSPNPDALRSLTTTFTPRSSGQVGLQASWNPNPAASTLTLTKEPATGAATLDQVQYPAATSLAPAYSHAVTGGQTYRMTLMNESADAGRTSLTATVNFP
jgi:hypothetical protein